jgi:hypothetical protein
MNAAYGHVVVLRGGKEHDGAKNVARRPRLKPECPMNGRPWLVADLGGTNARLALAQIFRVGFVDHVDGRVGSLIGDCAVRV